MVPIRVLLALAAVGALLYAARAANRSPLDRALTAVTVGIALYFTAFTVWRPSPSLGLPFVLLLGGLLLIAFSRRFRPRDSELRIGLLLPGAVAVCWSFALLLEADRIARSWPW